MDDCLIKDVAIPTLGTVYTSIELLNTDLYNTDNSEDEVIDDNTLETLRKIMYGKTVYTYLSIPEIQTKLQKL